MEMNLTATKRGRMFFMWYSGEKYPGRGNVSGRTVTDDGGVRRGDSVAAYAAPGQTAQTIYSIAVKQPFSEVENLGRYNPVRGGKLRTIITLGKGKNFGR